MYTDWFLSFHAAQGTNIAKNISIFENQNVFIFYKTCLGNKFQKYEREILYMQEFILNVIIYI